MLILFSIFAFLATHTPVHGRALSAAVELYAPLVCAGPFGVERIGTGFPISEHRLMSAAHVVEGCDEGGGSLLVQTSNGAYYLATDRRDDALDMAVFSTNASFKHVAKFRGAVLGERVAGYGSGLTELGPGLAVNGTVEITTVDWVIFERTLPGMSGSALVADDGYVVGMTVMGAYTRGYAGFAMAIPAAKLEAFIEGK